MDRDRDQLPRPDRDGEVAAWLTTIMFLLWCCYSLNGFRGWWQPIELSDENSGAAIRQVLFGGGALVSLLILWMRGEIWDTIREQWRLMLLGAWLLLTVAYSELPATTAKRAALFVCGTIMAVTIVAVARDPLRRVGGMIILITGLAAWLSIMWWLFFPEAITTNPGRPGLAGISNHPNTLAPALAIGLIASLSGLGGRRTALCLVSALGCGLALVLTWSITSLGMAFVALLVFVTLLLPSYWRALGIVVCAGAAVGVVLLGLSQVRDSVLDGLGRDASMSGRDALWEAIVNRIWTSPVFGQGWGAFWIEGRGRELVGTWNPRQSHNAYLDVLLDLGFVGLGLFVLVLVPAIWRLYKIWSTPGNPNRVLAAAMIAVMAGLLLVYAFQQSFLGKVDAFAFAIMLLICTASTASVAKEATNAALLQRESEMGSDASGFLIHSSVPSSDD